ncbi:MAG: hypothetical protein ACRC6V_03180 [Bacteroidales bacterium]
MSKKGVQQTKYAKYYTAPLVDLVKKWFINDPEFVREAAKRCDEYFSQDKAIFKQVKGTLSPLAIFWSVFITRSKPSEGNLVRTIPRIENGELLEKLLNQVGAHSFAPTHVYGDADRAIMVGFHTRVTLVIGIVFGIIELNEEAMLEDGVYLLTDVLCNEETFPAGEENSHGFFLTSQDAQRNVLKRPTENRMFAGEIKDSILRAAVESEMGQAQKGREFYSSRSGVENNSDIFRKDERMAKLIIMMYASSTAAITQTVTKRTQSLYGLWETTEERFIRKPGSIKHGAYTGIMSAASEIFLKDGEDFEMVLDVVKEFMQSEFADIEREYPEISDYIFDAVQRNYTDLFEVRGEYDTEPKNPSDFVFLSVKKAFRALFLAKKKELAIKAAEEAELVIRAEVEAQAKADLEAEAEVEADK